MSSVLSIPVGVVVAREMIAHPWQSHRWRPVSIFLDAPRTGQWRELRRDDRSVLYHAATLNLELFRKETTAYRVNLANGEPTVYVVLREDPDSDNEWPVDVHLVTASPFEAQSHGDVGLDNVEGVPMPAQLVEVVQAFIDEHHHEEPFFKRKRQPHLRAEEHKFGQEPVVALRERMSDTIDGAPSVAKPDATRGIETGGGEK
ncbi:MAG: DUF3305 domain-containing protein [Alphaproteobacteria bacterium]|nr:DUF3305 domain-containing protein [Alphaproteobacteria bacterium]